MSISYSRGIQIECFFMSRWLSCFKSVVFPSIFSEFPLFCVVVLLSPILLGSHERGDDDVPAGLEAAIHLQADFVAQRVLELRDEGIELDEMAILVRASHQMRAFEDRFLTIGLPYRVIGGPRFYERMEIRDAMAYFRVVTSPDDDLAFERIVNTPKRGLGDKAQQTIQTVARANGVPLVEGARLAVEQGLIKGKGGTELARLVDDLTRWGRMAQDTEHSELAGIILDESGYTTMWQNDKTPEAPGRLENLKELVKALEEFENLQGFLEHVSLIMDNDKGGDGEKVSIMTLHAAKGLEFPAVFLPGWEDGLFPSQRSMDESGLKGLEEERRLAYVGITRARQRCFISHAANRRVFNEWRSGIPSRFVEELPADAVEVRAETGLYGASAQPGGDEMRDGVAGELAHQSDLFQHDVLRKRCGGIVVSLIVLCHTQLALR